MQVAFHLLSVEDARRSMDLFAREVLPKFSAVPAPA
jgi:hypothetical protein